ncbi:exonuclease [Cellulophaga phage phi14:2]|uniref:PD-(D/E)XK nuclease superfamily protein n=1 Tax=Cellulophaga phage phi14:2 TaxID=1327990 RepID=S0A2A5_9CAUD|nr:exonuclease [Cellulophaga phage phi14:2]AGO48935.1 hypothetical protein Phi14:2_gp057 [Cellulophaga phage phi14:2]
MTEQEYRDLPVEDYLNYSLISKVDREGPKALLDKEDISQKTSIKWGKLAHALLLGKEIFDDCYKVLKNVCNITDTYDKLKVELIKNFLHNEIKISDVSEITDTYIEVCHKITKELKLWSNIKKPDLLIAKYSEESFVKFLVEQLENLDDEREKISSESFMEASFMCKVLKTNKFTAPYVKTNDIKKRQLLFEMPLLFEFANTMYKAMLDIICIDHENKTIRMVDLKTGTDDFKKFKSKFFFWRYDIQAALYTIALESFIVKQNFKNYRILDPLYIYVNKFDLENPYVFRVSESVVLNAITGYETADGYTSKGILELSEDIKYYIKNKSFNYDREYLTKGEILIDYNKDYHRTNSVPSNTFSNYTRSRMPEFTESMEDNPNTASLQFETHRFGTMASRSRGASREGLDENARIMRDYTASFLRSTEPFTTMGMDHFRAEPNRTEATLTSDQLHRAINEIVEPLDTPDDSDTTTTDNSEGWN